MQINTHVFQAAATIYESLLASPDNKVPYDPAYAYEAHQLAKTLYEACKNDPIYTMAAARCLCGFKQNLASRHCSREELINYALLGAGLLVDAFASAPQPVERRTPQFAVPVAPNGPPNVPNNHPPPEMPPPALMQNPASQPLLQAPPPVPVNVPDFTVVERT